ncbi:uncharacterized protein LOC111681309 [Lucilia cuprina]|uniref:uncharacterized protein LOC111681309 n=1 Tax=Lucilia cuprina TaxID=7375 RepID=UPI001F05A438|nr:uncharacterized protein LOC111681309 [Lucilia cuprina]
MNLVTSCIIFLLFNILFGVMADGDKSNCMKDCFDGFNPVCATIEDLEGNPIDCNFGNECILGILTCVSGKKEIAMKPEPCAVQNPKCLHKQMSFKGSEEFINSF